MKSIKFQEEESKVYGLRIGRSGRIDNFDLDDISREIIDGKYDVCRLKLSLEDSGIFDKLDRLGYYHSPYTVMSRTKLNLTAAHAEVNIPDGMSFELYDGSQAHEIEQLIRDGFSVATSVSYHSPLYSHVFPDASFMEASIKYFLSFNSSIDPQKVMYLFRYNNRYIGCYCVDISEEEVDTPLGLMHPDFRNTGQTQLMMQHCTQTAYNLGRSKLGSDASLQNLPSVRAQLSYGMKLHNSYLNVVVYPFLSKCTNSLAGEVPTDISEIQIFEKIVSHLSTSVSKFKECTFKTSYHHLETKTTSSEILLSPLQLSSDNFFIAGKQVENTSGQILKSFYLKGIKA